MENKSLIFIGLFAKGQCQEQPDAIIAVDSYNSEDAIKLINGFNDAYDSHVGVEGTAEGRIEYIVEALEEQIQIEIVTNDLYRIDL